MHNIRKMKNGDTLVEFIVIAAISIIVVGMIFGFFSRHVFGNKQIIDFNKQKFTAAYVLSNSNVWEKIQIKAWKDWDKSDSIQIVTKDGNVIYTHLCNVKLVEK